MRRSGLMGIAVLTALPATAQAQAEADPRAAIVVTGERFARTVQETASSVAVTTGEDLRERPGANTVNDVLQLAPNVQLAGTQNNGPTIRGQNTTGVLSGVDAFLGGSRPRTTILVDGRPLSFNEFIFGETGSWDIDQIEVFLGPQTTTQGANSIAGIINVRTRDPVHGFEGAVRGIASNYDTYQLSGMVNVSLVQDQVALRLVGDHRTHDSFLTFSAPQGPIGADPGKDEFTSFRAKLLVEPDGLPGFRGVLTYNYADTAGPQTELILVPPEGSEARIYPPYEAPVFATETHSLIADLSQQLSDRLVLSNILTYTRGDIRRYAPPGTGVADNDREEFTNETLLTYGTAGDRLSGIGGLYYQKFSADEFVDLAAFGLGNGAFTDDVESIGVFGEITVSPIDRFFVTAGLRYQSDNQARDGGFSAGFLTPIAFDRTFEAWLPKFGVAYDLTDDVRLGFLAQRGFNPGGVTISFFTGEIDTFDKESLWNYELYWRASLLDDRLMINGNIFYTDFKNAQRPVNRELPTGQLITELGKAEDARSYGAEVQLSYAPSDIIAFDVALGLLETEIKRVTSEPNLEGNDFERAPGMTVSAGLRVEPLDNLVLSANGRYVDSYFSDDANTPEFRIGSYFMANAQVSYEWGPARIFAYATNIFDDFTLLQRFGDTANVTDPRQYGAGVEFRF